MRLKSLLLFCFLYCLLFALLYPWYQYVLDVDATAYLKVAERLAIGEYEKSVNGFWSPLNSWLLAPFIKAGFNAVTSAKILNGIFGLGTLISLFFLLKKFIIDKIAIKGMITAFVFILLHLAFDQLFGDLLQVFILSIYLNIICSTNFLHNSRKIIASAFICGLAYYAKYYTFYFGIAFNALLFFVLLRKETRPFPVKLYITKTLLACTILIITVLPWAFALKEKYGTFTFATTGKVDQSMILSEGSDTIQAKSLVQPLPYTDSYSNWDDPSYHWQGTFIHPFTNISFFLREMKLFISAAQTYIFILNDFSFVALGVLLICLFLYCSKNSRFVQNSNNYILLSFTMIMPLGYLFMHIEPRFVWTVYLIIIILSGVLLTMLKDVQWMTPALFVLICIIVFSSFCLYPINQLQDQRYKGQDAYDIYAAFKKRNIHGTFVANSSTNNEEAKLKIFAYLSKSHFIITHPAITEEEILQVIKYYQANYYIMYYTSSYEKEGMLHSTVAKNAADVLIDVSPGVIVFRFK